MWESEDKETARGKDLFDKIRILKCWIKDRPNGPSVSKWKKDLIILEKEKNHDNKSRAR